MKRFTTTMLVAGLALFTLGSAHAAAKTAKTKAPATASAKPAGVMECCAKGGCGACEAGNSAFFTSTSCKQCAAGVMNVAMHGKSADAKPALGNAAFFTATRSTEVGNGKTAQTTKTSKTKK